MHSKLKIKLFPGWRLLQNAQGPVTYVRGNDPNPSALQFSVAHRRNGVFHGAAEEGLIGICKQATGKVRDSTEISKSSGTCQFGLFGTVTVTGSSPVYMQAWVVTNRHDFILVTHICDRRPDAEEIKEANETALMSAYL